MIKFLAQCTRRVKDWHAAILRFEERWMGRDNVVAAPTKPRWSEDWERNHAAIMAKRMGNDYVLVP